MPTTADMLTTAEAASELGISPITLRRAVMLGTIEVVRLDKRTNLFSRAEVEKYRREHLGQWGRGRRKQSAEGLTEQQRKQRAYQQAFCQRRKAARQQQPATSSEPVEE